MSVCDLQQVHTAVDGGGGEVVDACGEATALQAATVHIDQPPSVASFAVHHYFVGGDAVGEDGVVG